MSSEGGGVRGSEEKASTRNKENYVVLRECLIGGDAEQSRRERQLRRRSLMVSTLLQALVVLAIVTVPFFGKVERIALANVMPIPPYHPYGGPSHPRPTTPAPNLDARPTFCFMCPPAHPTNRSAGGNQRSSDSETGDVGSLEENTTSPCSSCIIIGKTEGPRPPENPVGIPSVVRMTHIDPAMLIERVEPAYPPLARQIRRDGRVELHAIISTDGTVEQLEIVSGDALFYQSALDAVRRWRYRATKLNGQAVKVDTYITVIYTMQQQ
jgi:TonB family protein